MFSTKNICYKLFYCLQVRNVDVGWKEIKKILRKDYRWGMVDVLSKNDKEVFFKSYIESLNYRKKEQFRKLLDEIYEVCQLEFFNFSLFIKCRKLDWIV